MLTADHLRISKSLIFSLLSLVVVSVVVVVL